MRTIELADWESKSTAQSEYKTDTNKWAALQLS